MHRKSPRPFTVVAVMTLSSWKKTQVDSGGYC